MELHLTDDRQALVEGTRRFLDAEMPLHAVRTLAEHGDDFSEKYWQQGGQLGWTAMLAPEALGGGSLTDTPIADLALLAEEFGSHVAPGPLASCNAVIDALVRIGSPPQQQSIVDITGGTSIAVCAHAEPGAGWDGLPIDTRAQRSGSDYRISGVKHYVEAVSRAQHFLVTALTTGGTSQFIVHHDAPGLSVHPLESLDPSRRFGTVVFDSVSVPKESLVGIEGGAAESIARQLNLMIALQCAETVGAMGRVFDMTISWVQERYAFGRPIGSYQALKHRLADHKLWLEVAYASSVALSHAVATHDIEASALASAAKAQISESSLTLIQDSIQMFGGIGVTWEHDLHLYLRRATTNFALLGTPSQHRERLCALLEV